MNEVAEKVLRHRTHHCGAAIQFEPYTIHRPLSHTINSFPSNVFHNVNASKRLICVRARLWCKCIKMLLPYISISGLSSMQFYCPSSHHCIELYAVMFTQIERKFSIFHKILDRIVTGGFFSRRYFSNWFCLCVCAALTLRS